MDTRALFDYLKIQNEMNPDLHDGSYELMRGIIASYANMSDYSKTTVDDLNAIYMMAIGTWKSRVDHKKNLINLSSLPEDEKIRLGKVIDRVWDNASYSKYENMEQGKPSIGMFGTGFFSFKSKTPDDRVGSFIAMLVDISKKESDGEMFDRAEILLGNGFPGMGAASVSVILHCLKPFTFPILNSHMGIGNVFEPLGVKLDHPGKVSTYIKNAREIKAFRDSNFSIKNYRIFDIAANELGMEEKDIDEQEGDVMTLFDHNTILYGPPGTGKTYNTVLYAVSIIEGKSYDELTDENYDDVKTRYDQYKADGKIAFTTFHQSYGYEEFIEGIKPEVTSNSEDGKIKYSIVPGVFKEFCERAYSLNIGNIKYTNNVWAIRNKRAYEQYDFETSLYKDQIIKIADYEGQGRLIDNMAIGDWVVLGREYAINAIGVVTDYQTQEFDDGIFRYKRNVRWLVTGINYDSKEINQGKAFSNFKIANSEIKAKDLRGIVCEYKSNIEPYVFIIDEINRGNISKIFGELITLIESTKREGTSETASAILPYSGEEFSVPSNVFILGTMNTADRSIALMDTALRRRFSFVEMLPRPELLDDVEVVDNGESVNIGKLLRSINKRIEHLYDREHTIGHAPFMKLIENPSMDVLENIFAKSVIPLLQEYFYGDYSKIRMVLGDNAKKNIEDQFIVEITLNWEADFLGNQPDDIDIPEHSYEIKYENFKNIRCYKGVIEKL